jgi:signal transduction histidine kinase
MLLGGRAGALTAQQTQFLEETAKQFARLSVLVAEMSDLSNLDAATATFNRSSTDLRGVLRDAIAALPDVTEGPNKVNLTTGESATIVHADAARLTIAFTGILTALRRELVTAPALEVRQRVGESQGGNAAWIAFADAERIEALSQASPDILTTFDEWRGGCGLTLPVARRIITGHGGGVWSPADGPKTGAVVMLPIS